MTTMLSDAELKKSVEAYLAAQNSVRDAQQAAERAKREEERAAQEVAKYEKVLFSSIGSDVPERMVVINRVVIHILFGDGGRAVIRTVAAVI